MFSILGGLIYQSFPLEFQSLYFVVEGLIHPKIIKNILYYPATILYNFALALQIHLEFIFYMWHAVEI